MERLRAIRLVSCRNTPYYFSCSPRSGRFREPRRRLLCPATAADQRLERQDGARRRSLDGLCLITQCNCKMRPSSRCAGLSLRRRSRAAGAGFVVARSANTYANICVMRRCRRFAVSLYTSRVALRLFDFPSLRCRVVFKTGLA